MKVQALRLLRRAAALFGLALCLAAQAEEDGSRLWLRYPEVAQAERLADYRRALTQVVRASDSATLQAAQDELVTGLGGLLGRPLPVSDAPTAAGAIVLGTPASSPRVRSLGWDSRLAGLGPEGYLVEAVKLDGRPALVIAANTDVGVLYGSFALLRHLQMQRPIAGLALSGTPKIARRLLNHWDNPDGSVERGYAGRSLWQWNELPTTLSPRYRDYARANASIGINGAVLNNVNADARILRSAELDKVAALAGALRPWGIRVYLSARFSAPMEIGGLATADPLDPAVKAWWKDKVAEVYSKIPDFGGFLVKANSEGQPGPQTYGRSHADGARMLSDALGPHGGVVLWRAFVYGEHGPDRVRQAYDEFKPLDGDFGANAVVQVKNGPLDFQPREPFHPLFGAMPRTPLALELQITKEYLGADSHLAYLGTLFEEVLRSDTHAQGPGSTVARVVDGSLDGHALSAISGVANIGSDANWTGSHFNQANWYAFGRLAWDPDASARDIAEEWVRQTWSNDPAVVGPVTRMMMASRQAVVDYMTPLGLVHQMGTDHHYGPSPWVKDLGNASWNPAYYHRADRDGIGFDRSESGSDAVAQYAPAVRDRFASRATVGDDLLLFFHHVGWDERLASGRSVWAELVHRYSAGVDAVHAMRETWQGLHGRIDGRRFAEVADFLRIQHHEARWWRDASLQYFASVSGRDLPAGYAAPGHALGWYQDLARRCPPDAAKPRCPEVYAGEPSPAILAPTTGGELTTAGLSTNGRTLPLGISGDDISLGWTLTAHTRGAVQQAYQVRVGTQPGRGDVWDSGKVASERQADVRLPAKLQPATRYHWQVRAWDGRGRVGPWSRPTWFETGLQSAADWQGAQWIAAPFDAADQPRPLLRASLRLDKPVLRARLYASARGVYQLWVNGRPVGDQALAPGWTDYARRLQVQTYDVTALLRPGANAVGAALADGWYRGKVGMGWRAVYGQQLALKTVLRITYADGSSQAFGTGTGSEWLSLPGPWLQADLQDGEHYDARRLPAGWAEPGFDDGAWQPVVAVAETEARLVPQPDEPVRATEVRRAQARLPGPAGAFVYDLGQNLVGVARVRLTGRAGQTVRLRHAEELHRRGERRGQLYTDNLRGAAATDSYTFAHDGTVTWQPRFTQHGFRYLEISGLDSPPALADVQAVVLGSDLPAVGELRLSHPMLDQLVRNIRWGARGNLLSIPTDTPARDERLGWTGDINVFAPTAARLFDMRAFLSKWMDDMADAQRPDGNIPAVVPFPGRNFGETGVGWSDAFITVPYATWRASGDTALLRRHWRAIRRFYDFVHASATADGNLLEEGRASWFSGDWLSLEGVDRLREHPVIATAYFAEDTRMMAEMAAALGEAAQAEAWQSLAARIRSAFAQAYRAPDGRIEPGTQTVYAMALGMGLLAPGAQRDATAARFVEKIAGDDFHLKTGFLGTPWLLPALSAIGRDDLAMQLLLNEDAPSWGFEVRMGATTVWERWNSIGPDGAFGPVEMNSFNHYANGAVADWMFGRLGGLQIVEAGYRKARIAPWMSHPAVSQARASLKTPFGLLACRWRRAPDGLHLEVEVPVGTEAEVLLPTTAPERVREGRRAASRAPGVRQAAWKDGLLRLRLGSGRYGFFVPAGPEAPA
ncbi:family 78 glycoside hydrolase catalytic domain [Pelomonas sp. P7]|uniref:Xylan alpha-1,2-glucuronidase n=1 Tax=Pelomonas caseinilytica TaxID=2906763 RepID=A0ABS8XEM6_9BURK|nr:family 78 glycoside hydrolase catalytic domain [Pelomonas sp. P7]MCE4536939.1 family 78 glycoside hydrolase catalytic domain [Pelomonas sp. P7]